MAPTTTSRLTTFSFSSTAFAGGTTLQARITESLVVQSSGAGGSRLCRRACGRETGRARVPLRFHAAGARQPARDRRAARRPRRDGAASTTSAASADSAPASATSSSWAMPRWPSASLGGMPWAHLSTRRSQLRTTSRCPTSGRRDRRPVCSTRSSAPVVSARCASRLLKKRHLHCSLEPQRVGRIHGRRAPRRQHAPR